MRILFILMLAFSSSAWSTNYYVTESGAGAANGTSLADAWSMSTFNSTTTPAAGDTVFVSGAISTVINGNKGGTSGNPLIIDTSGATIGTGIVIDQSYITYLGGAVSSTATSDPIISCSGAQTDVGVKNFSYTGPTGGGKVFLAVNTCAFTTVEGNTIDNVGTFVEAASGGSTHDLTIKNNYARTSINLSGQIDLIFLADIYNVLIEGNKLINQAPGSQANSRHNDVIQTFKSGGGGAINPYSWTIRYNWIELSVTQGDTDGSNSWTMLEGMTGTNKIYSNVFVGSMANGLAQAGNGLDFNSSAAGMILYFYNNSFAAHDDPNGTIRFQNTGTLYARNNAGYGTGISGGTSLEWDWTAGATWDKNFFYGFGACTSTHTGANGSCSTDPLFTSFTTNDLSLSLSSPLIGIGDDSIGAEYAFGIAPGASWPNPQLVARPAGDWDVGAYQSPPPLFVEPVTPSFKLSFEDIVTDGNTTTYKDTSPNTRHCLTGGTSTPTVVSGKFGNGVQFDSSDFITCPWSNYINVDTNFTISAWVKTNVALTGPRAMLIRPASTAPTAGAFTNVYGLAVDNGYSPQKPHFGWEIDGSPYTYANRFDNVLPGVGEWHHYAVSYSPTMIKFYTDGIPVHTYNNTTSGYKVKKAFSPLLIGGATGNNVSGCQDCVIDEIVFYPQALTDAEMLVKANQSN